MLEVIAKKTPERCVKMDRYLRYMDIKVGYYSKL